MRSRSRHVIAPLVAVAAIALVAGWVASRGGRVAAPRQAEGTVTQVVGSTMGGSWSVRLARPLEAGAAEKVRASVQETLDRVDRQMSTWKPDSDVSRFNAYRGTDWFEVPDDVATIVAEARRVSEETGGAFDVTVGPLVNLWGFGPAAAPAEADQRVPSEEAVAAARARVDYRRLDVRATPPALRKLDRDVYIDLSAIAQGYAADLVALQLDAADITNYLVEVCGEFRAGGAAQDRPWRVALQAPVPDTLLAFRTVQLNDGLALATSGVYQNFFEDRAGRRYSHEIDPRTGRPIAHGLASVSVAHQSAATADALATALMVLGPQAALAHAEEHALAAFLVVRVDGGMDFQTHATPAFEDLLVGPTSGSVP